MTPRQLLGLNKLGDFLIPGTSKLPSFSQSGCGVHAGRILDHMPDSDRKDLLMLLGIFSFLPAIVVRFLIQFLYLLGEIPGTLGAMPRFILTGLKGLTVTLYWSGETGPDYQGLNPVQTIGYQVKILTDDLD